MILEGERGFVKGFQSEGKMQVFPFDPRRWHATRQWSGNLLVLAVYKVRGLDKFKGLDREIVERLCFRAYPAGAGWGLGLNPGCNPRGRVQGGGGVQQPEPEVVGWGYPQP